MILTGLMLSMIASAQYGFQFKNISNGEVTETKLSFVSGNKTYVLTYEPVAKDMMVDHKNLYLYRKDSDGWKKASELIRVDSCNDKGSIVREIVPYTIHRNDGQPIFSMEDCGMGSVYKTSKGIVYITFQTNIWNPKGNYSYNSILVFIPNGNETYNFSYFEPKSKEYKVIKNFSARKMDTKDGYLPILTNGKKTYSYRTINIAVPVLYGVNKTEFLETSDGLTIKYWDANRSNPQYWSNPEEGKPYVAGELNFKIFDSYVGDHSHVACGSNTIKLTQVK